MKRLGRRQLQVEGPRWVMMALLAFAGASKVSAYLLGMPVMPLAGGSGVVRAALPALAAISTVGEVALAIALGLVAAPRRLLPLALWLATAWVSALVIIRLTGTEVSHCGCLGPRLQLSLLDHVLLTSGVILLCASQARRLMAPPWRWYAPVGRD